METRHDTSIPTFEIERTDHAHRSSRRGDEGAVQAALLAALRDDGICPDDKLHQLNSFINRSA